MNPAQGQLVILSSMAVKALVQYVTLLEVFVPITHYIWHIQKISQIRVRNLLRNFVGSHGLIITVSAFTHLLVSKLSTLCLNGG